MINPDDYEVLGYDGAGYPIVEDPRRPSRHPRRYRLIWELTHGPVEGPYSIIHINNDRFDDRPANLELKYRYSHPHYVELAEAHLGFEINDIVFEYANNYVSKRWAGSEDLEIYSTWEYLVSILQFDFGHRYASISLKYLEKSGIKVRTILDHGCGTGSCAFFLEELLPRTKVVGSNSPGQLLDFNRYVNEKRGSTIEFVDEARLSKYGHFDVLCAFELFEHFKEPVEELRELVDRHTPNVIFEASSFTRHPHTGHYGEFLIDGEALNGSKTMSRFTKELLGLGYHRISKDNLKVRLWNNHPRVFVRN